MKRADIKIIPGRNPHWFRSPARRAALLSVAALFTLILTCCDDGLVVPEREVAGAISGKITYLGGGTSWPPHETIFDIRFVAMRFVPVDTADFLQLNRMEISNSLIVGAGTDSFFIADVTPGAFPYSGVAYRFSEDIFDWRPVGVYTQNGGLFTVENGDTTHVSIVVDFQNPPIFPPEL